jgi:hypothetical protein
MKKFAIIIGALLLILLAFATYVLINKDKISEVPVDEVTNEDQLEVIDESNLKSLVVKHQYKDGKHIFMGDVETGTPCYDISAIVEDTQASTTKNIKITTTNNQGENDCTQVIDTKTFKVEYEGSVDLKFIATLNGERMRLNRFDLAPEVNIDEFELFIKG